MLFDGGMGATYKVLKAYMGEAVWLAKPPGAYLGTMVWVVVMLFGQHQDQLKMEFYGWKATSSHWIHANGRILKTFVRGFNDPTLDLVVWRIGS